MCIGHLSFLYNPPCLVEVYSIFGQVCTSISCLSPLIQLFIWVYRVWVSYMCIGHLSFLYNPPCLVEVYSIFGQVCTSISCLSLLIQLFISNQKKKRNEKAFRKRMDTIPCTINLSMRT